MRLTVLYLSGFELYSRWVPLKVLLYLKETTSRFCKKIRIPTANADLYLMGFDR